MARERKVLRKPRLFVQVRAWSSEPALWYRDADGQWSDWDDDGGDWMLRPAPDAQDRRSLRKSHVEVRL